MIPAAKYELKPGVRSDLWEVVARLKELGLTVAQMSDPVRRGYMAVANCTANHPPLMRGVVGWGEVVCALRENLAPSGWTRSDANNYSVVNDPVGYVAIAVATGDESTGIPNASPSTKSAKGPQTVSAVNFNHNQLPLLFDNSASSDTDPATDDPHNSRVTYILLVHRAPNEVRYELSLPDQITDGRINGWVERIIFGAIPLDGEPIELMPPTQPDLNIDVKRRTA